MKGRPFLGILSGFLFGLFLGITLFLFGVIPLNSDLLLILPILGIVVGLVMAWWAPFGKPPTAQGPITSPPIASKEPKSPEPGSQG